MDDAKKGLLKETFWAMNEVSYSTDTATHTDVTETDDRHGNIVETTTTVTETTLYITVSHKTADEMADIYNFTADQRRQLAELLAEESRSIWSAVLYGIGTGDGEIVTVALSQIGNVAVSPIGHGTALALVWSGAPALSVGVPMSAGIWTLA